MPDRPVVKLYCDESGLSTDRYMVVGGIVIPRDNFPQLVADIKEIRRAHDIRDGKEIKWNDMRNHRVPAYETYVDYFFDLLSADRVHYHTIVFDNHTLDRVTYPNATTDSVLSRMYYQLMLHRCVRFYGRAYNLHMRPDRADAPQELPNLRAGLNSEAMRRYEIDSAPVRSIEPRDSKDEHLLQINDIILGGIAHHRNGRHANARCSRHKKHLAAYILGKTGLSSYAMNTPYRARQFTVWNFVSPTS